MRYRLVALSGPAGVGKSTLAQGLVDTGEWVAMGWMDPVRDALVALGVPRDALVDRARKDSPLGGRWGDLTPRQLMVSLGDWGRAQRQDLWALSALDRAARATPMGVVLHDTRLDLEASAVRLAGGLVVHLESSAVPWSGGHLTESGVCVGLGDVVIRTDQPYLQSLGQLARAVRG